MDAFIVGSVVSLWVIGLSSVALFLVKLHSMILNGRSTSGTNAKHRTRRWILVALILILIASPLLQITLTFAAPARWFVLWLPLSIGSAVLIWREFKTGGWEDFGQALLALFMLSVAINLGWGGIAFFAYGLRLPH